MNDLVQRLIDKTGLSEEQAASAVQAVAGFLKERLPAPIAAQVENVLGSGAEAATSGIGASLGGMFGKG
ncbi:hypothetical protein ACPWT1_21185 [Ramlibacter sp. MMS24-I3-19]|uniref:hypothetical protein n=1 Tax=Ramlibacter sp. MMS24-I3-19 TaxID=3416606 RepID=UPI003D08079C